MIFFKNQSLMPLIWLLLGLIPLLAGEYYFRRRQESRFLEGQSGRSGLGKDQVKRSLYLFFACLFALAAILRPSWNPTVRIVEKEGRDVVFLLDVSRSMTASDVAPNRLERAKLEIAETVQVMEGDRVALVAFAGNSVVKCPLTMDYGFFSLALDDITVNSVSRGGSQLGDALRMVDSQVFDDRSREERDVILITDGEDQESFPVEAAGALGGKGVRLIVIGLGDEIQGARVKDRDGQYLTYDGQEVWSRMDGDTLRQMAAATPGGSYIPAGVANFSLPRLYKSLVGGSAKKSTGEEESLVYEEKYQFFLALAVIFLLLEAFRIIGRVEWGRTFLRRFMKKNASLSPRLLVLIPLLGILPAIPLNSEGRADLFRQGEEALNGEDWEGFKQIYDDLKERGASEGKLSYNRGRSLFRQGDYSGAAGAFGDAASRLDPKKASRALYNRGNSLLKQAEADPSGGAGLTSQARESYERALELDPRYKDAARNLELLLQNQEENPQSQSGDGDPSESGDDDDSDGQQSSQQGSQSDTGKGDNQQSPQGDDQSRENNSQNQQEQSASEQDRNDQAQQILDQEEADRDERESTLSVSGGLYDVERDW